MWTWGTNTIGQLGDGTTTSRAVPVPASGLSLVDNTWLLGDQDQDGLVTWREYLVGTDPLSADTAGTGVGDRALLQSGRNAATTDANGDGMSNADAIKLGCDPFGAACQPLPPLPSDPNDHVPPIITLIEPRTAVRIH